MTGLKKQLIAHGRQLGFDLIKIASADPLEVTKLELEKRIHAGIYPSLAIGSPEERTTPTLLLPHARSVIMVAMAYSIDPTILKERAGCECESLNLASHRGELSRYAWGDDYHRVMGPRLKQLAEFITTKVPGAQCRAMVDSGPLAEKAMAYRAGLGFFGWNSCLITKEFGSWVFLGALVTTLALEPDAFQPRTCKQCGACLEACPTGAIIAPYVVQPELCLSYITQMRGIIPHGFRQPLGNRLFGCDTCQAVCPHNDAAVTNWGNHREFMPHPDIGQAPPLEKILTLSNRVFKQSFAQIAAGWRGRNILQRNALINLGNTLDASVLPLVNKYLQDPSEPVRAGAVWAIANIAKAHGGAVARDVIKTLAKARAKETSDIIDHEILAALEGL
ncbi:MAG: tRNA epoxyqueuosine(34) reductase QueG [Firmicutes bacterium]|nr:tRNA epoxyqueuosine(34) reductase QueG [Bacillota bacterium]